MTRAYTLMVATSALALTAFTVSGSPQLSPLPPVLRASAVPLPYTEGDNAIWGATGQDSRGHIWFGISTGGITPNSARLVEYTPDTNLAVDRGNVVAELTRAGVAKPDDQQAKIHSKIVQGPDNYLYFASMDEDGEKSDGTALPTWGGHFWRLNLATSRWQHLMRVPEALIAVGVGGRFAYALGYFGHVLYQYDTSTGRTARVEVGSVDGHITRNFLVDDRGHAYVPRLTAVPGAGAGGSRLVRVSLVEFGTDLREIRATPIDAAYYLGSSRPTDAHGIVGLQTMADRSMLFTTHAGRLFRIVPPAAGAAPAEVTNAGWIHPRGSSYAASLFSSDGRSSIATLARASNNPRPWEWLKCQWPSLACQVSPLRLPEFAAGDVGRMLLYGSSTRDAQGGHYVVGMTPGARPIVIRLQQ